MVKEVVRELENYQHVSPEANVSRFSFICYSSETGMLYYGFIVLVSHPNTNPARQGLTSVNFSITKLSDAQRVHLW